MNSFAAALLTTAVIARGPSGGINQGYGGTSKGAQHGFGYNVGNGYTHGDSHQNNFGHQRGYGATNYSGMGMDTGSEWTAPDFHDHMTGYDSVQADSTWDTATGTNAVTW